MDPTADLDATDKTEHACQELNYGSSVVQSVALSLH